LLAIPKVAFKIVSVGFEHVKNLVLDLPAGPAAGGKLGDDVSRDGEIGDEAVVVGPLSLVVEGPDGEPVDRDGILCAAQRHCVEPAIDSGGALAAFADGLATLLQFGTVQVLGDGLVREWLARQDERAAGVGDGRNDRLAGEQIVAENDRRR
jgi:hypothetical protein